MAKKAESSLRAVRSKRKEGRDSRQEKIAAVLANIADGKSVREACVKAGISRSVFLRNADAEQYARARDAQADTHFAGMVDLETQCLNGELDPQAFRVALDSMKWRLARMRPKVYGDQANLTVNFDEPPKLEIVLTGVSKNDGFGRAIVVGGAPEGIEEGDA
ncbi:MAG: hypothetical protein LBQ10_06145 [Desulfovibrio sp.]|jgi:hypothetical protein|nr:hypothetical protein [Desulfovibrio sp.]